MNAQSSYQEAIELALGQGLGRTYYRLYNELAWLYLKWSEYQELFGEKPSRIDLMNRAAPEFFRMLQDSLWEDVLLHLCRLTDPPRSAGKDTLTICRLPLLIQDCELRQRVEGLTQIARDKTKFARDWRNRHIAHRDLKLALEEPAEPLEPASRKSVNQAFEAIAEVLNAIAESKLNHKVGYEHTEAFRGALSLLHVIDDGLRFDQERRERLHSGQSRPDDYQPRDI